MQAALASREGREERKRFRLISHGPLASLLSSLFLHRKDTLDHTILGFIRSQTPRGGRGGSIAEKKGIIEVKQYEGHGAELALIITIIIVGVGAGRIFFREVRKNGKYVEKTGMVGSLPKLEGPLLPGCPAFFA